LCQSFTENFQPRKIAEQIPMEDLLKPTGYQMVLNALIRKYRTGGVDVAAFGETGNVGPAAGAALTLGSTASKHYPVISEEAKAGLPFFQEGNAEDEGEDEGGQDGKEDEESEELDEDEMYMEDRECEEDEAIFLEACHSAYADV
ncbi:unnamed protein product, partial [Symbiodinium sp. CCMP2456]